MKVVPTSKVVAKYKASKKLLKLSDRYLKIFEFRHGFTDGIQHTLNETGKQFQISGTRARQINARVIYELEQI